MIPLMMPTSWKIPTLKATVTVLAFIATLPVIDFFAKDASGMRSDLARILEAAHEVNGLDGSNVSPWHMKVSYQTFDVNSQPKISGSYEELWISPKKYRRTYTSTSFSQTDFATDHGLYRSGNANWPSAVETSVRADLLQPVPADIDLREVVLEENSRSFGQAQLQCISLRPKRSNVTVHVVGQPDSEVYPRYCFEQNEPVLRFKSQGGGAYDTFYDNIIPFQGHYLARDVRVMNGGRPLVTLHVETIESLSAINAADFVPPSGAIGPIQGKITLSSSMLHDRILKWVPPNYPESAKRAHVQGTVAVRVTVGRDGHVVAAEAVTGPSMLQQAALDSVRKWEFRPFLILGEPTEVESELEVSFALASR